MGEQKPEKTKKHICAGLLAHVEAAGAVTIADFPAVEVTATDFSVTAGEGIATVAPQVAQVGFLSFPRSKK